MFLGARMFLFPTVVCLTRLLRRSAGVSCIYTDESDVINADSKTISVTASEDFVAASEKELAVLGKAAYYAPAAARVGDVEFCSFEAAVMTDDAMQQLSFSRMLH